MNYGGSRRWPSQAEQEKIRAEREQAMFENQVQANLSYLCERISFRSLENAREYLAETLSEHNRYNRNNPIQSEVMRRFQLIAQEYIRHLENGGNVRQVIPI